MGESMTRPIGQPSHFGQWLSDFAMNDGMVTASQWFDIGNGISPDAGASAPVTLSSSLMSAPPALTQEPSGLLFASPMGSANILTPSINTGVASASTAFSGS